MKLEDQVCSLELAIRLKELGAKQESLFYWFECPVEYKYVIGNPNKDWLNYSAFTVAELGAMLPFTIKMNEWHGIKFDKPRTFYLHALIGYTDHGYSPVISYDYYIYEDAEELDETQMIVGPDFTDDNEANCRAKMLIFLLENGYTKNE